MIISKKLSNLSINTGKDRFDNLRIRLLQSLIYEHNKKNSNFLKNYKNEQK